MAPPMRPSLSITLPLSFEFHYNDGQLPKTPEHGEELQSAVEPPPPPRHTYKIKRKRATIPFPEPMPLLDTDTIIPTIEMSEAAPDLSSPVLQPTSSTGLLAPLPAFQRLVTPPKTPAPRTNSFSQTDSPANEWALINDSRDDKLGMERAGSVCSSFSDSSVSSYGSSGFSGQNSCTSPESVATDPFMEDDISKSDRLILSPAENASEPSAKRVKKHRHVKWTPEMDHHLENTYLMYLRDPTATPFKVLPGTAPPLGVCSRVARRARRTWSHSRIGTPTPLDTIYESAKTMREGSPDTIRPTTSAGVDAKQQVPRWPRSDGATRRRLRTLVKGKPQLSAYYQRLLRTRSPSPFHSSSTTTRSSEPPSFSGRDMKVSLITSTAPSMQPQGPLAQLSSDDTVDAPESSPQVSSSQRSSRPADWFSRIGRSQAHQKSLSLQSGLNLEAANPAAFLLPSPFDEASSRTHLLHSMSTTKSLGRRDFSHKLLTTSHAGSSSGPSLDSPFEATQGAPTAPRSLKRRFKSDEEKPRRPGLEDVFGPQPDDVALIRNRGFSVGAVRASSNSLAGPFVPPPSVPSPAHESIALPGVNDPSPDAEMSEAPPFSPSPSTTSSATPTDHFAHLGPVGSRSAPRRLAEPVPRLGSPFMPDAGAGAGPASVNAGARAFNTFPRSYVPTASHPQPFQERLRELVAGSSWNLEQSGQRN